MPDKRNSANTRYNDPKKTYYIDDWRLTVDEDCHLSEAQLRTVVDAAKKCAEDIEQPLEVAYVNTDRDKREFIHSLNIRFKKEKGR